MLEHRGPTHRDGKYIVSYQCKDCGEPPEPLGADCLRCGGHIICVAHVDAHGPGGDCDPED